jgi:hypothetical protein
MVSGAREDLNLVGFARVSYLLLLLLLLFLKLSFGLDAFLFPNCTTTVLLTTLTFDAITKFHDLDIPILDTIISSAVF